jgi:hypothetical protein
VITAACLIFVAHRLVVHLEEVPRIDWTWRAVLALAVAAALLVANGAIHALSWRALVRGADPSVTWAQSYAVTGRSQLAKYLPGNIFHHVQRVAFATTSTVALPAAARVTLVDALAVAAGGAIMAIPALGRAAAVLRERAIDPWPVLAVTSGLTALAIAAAWPRARSASAGLAYVVPGRLASAVLLDALLFVVAGIAMLLVLRGAWPAAPELSVVEVVPGFALAFLVGYVTPGSPGGVGVREAVLYGLYAPTLGSGLAAGLFVVFRVVSVAGDVLTFFVASAVHRSGVAACRS